MILENARPKKAASVCIPEDPEPRDSSRAFRDTAELDPFANQQPNTIYPVGPSIWQLPFRELLGVPVVIGMNSAVKKVRNHHHKNGKLRT